MFGSGRCVNTPQQVTFDFLWSASRRVLVVLEMLFVVGRKIDIRWPYVVFQ
jgi:hypothetical protein